MSDIFVRARSRPLGDHTGVVLHHSETPGRRVVGLRARVTLFFSVAGLLAALGLAAVTYVVTRNYLVDQRRDVALKQTIDNATIVRDALRQPRQTPTPKQAIESVRTDSRGYAVMHLDSPIDQPFGQDTSKLALDDIPV